MVTGTQIAAARALLGLSTAELADQARLPLTVIERLEKSHQELEEAMREATTLRSFLEKAGITFIDERTTSAAGGPGVRLSVPISTSIDTNGQETVQYPAMAKNGPFGAGG